MKRKAGTYSVSNYSRKEAYNMGLIVTRWAGEAVQLEIIPGTTAEELYQALIDGIRIHVKSASGSKASIEIEAPPMLSISRVEDA